MNPTGGDFKARPTEQPSKRGDIFGKKFEGIKNSVNRLAEELGVGQKDFVLGRNPSYDRVILELDSSASPETEGKLKKIAETLKSEELPIFLEESEQTSATSASGTPNPSEVVSTRIVGTERKEIVQKEESELPKETELNVTFEDTHRGGSIKRKQVRYIKKTGFPVLPHSDSDEKKKDDF